MLTSTSTGTDPAGWRRWWRMHGTTWRDIAGLAIDLAHQQKQKAEFMSDWDKLVEAEAAKIKPDPETERRRQLIDSDIGIERSWDLINSRAARSEAPETTYQASFYELSRHGIAQLSKANCQRRLGDLSDQQIKRLITALQQRRGQYSNITDELLNALATIYDARIRHEQ